MILFVKRYNNESFSDFMTFADLELVPVTDLVLPLPGSLSERFPTVSATEWALYRRLYPDMFLGDQMRTRLGTLVFRARDGILLIDTGIGPGNVGLARQFGMSGSLPAKLEEAGIAPESIDTVYLTHLHQDHVGWNVRPDAAPPAPMFPNARYLTHEAEWRHWSAFAQAQPEQAEVLRANVLPLSGLGVLDLVTGGATVAPGVTVLETFGHSPGHTSLVIEAGGQRLVVLGDAFVHPLQLAEPGHAMALDGDAEQATATRRRLLDLLTAEDVVVVGYHFPEPGLGRVVEEDGRLVWRPLALAGSAAG